MPHGMPHLLGKELAVHTDIREPFLLLHSAVGVGLKDNSNFFLMGKTIQLFLLMKSFRT
jgi:hypothetical protein